MASLPLFFYDGPLRQGSEVLLDEATSKHVIQVLRMQPGEELALADGKGHQAITQIITDNRKKCSVHVRHTVLHPRPAASLHLAVGFTKNASRNEWLLEKATELGVSSIIPLSTARTEKERGKYERWNNILVSAMLQSQQYYLPVLAPVTGLKELLDAHANTHQKLIGHCEGGIPRKALHQAMQPGKDTLVLIGPEGDFAPEEIKLCMDNGCTGIAMASQRLRTETAAMNVCAYFNTINYEMA